MRKMIAALLVLAAASVGMAQPAGQPGIGDDFYPDLGNGGYDVLQYQIAVSVADNLRDIEAVTTIELVATQDVSAFNFDFAGMTVDGIDVDGVAADYVRAGREMTVLYPLTTGGTYSVVVRYHGAPGVESDGSRIAFNLGWNYYGAGILVASQPDGAASWFPANDHPLDKAKFRISVEVPAPYVAVANGNLVETREGDGRTGYVWDMEYPMATYLATVNVADFALRGGEGSESGVPVRNYFPTRLADAGDRVFARQGEMIDYFETIFGPYPFDVYGVVVADVNLDFALETQTISLFGRNILARIDTGFDVSAESVIAHELAHQWFGNSLSPASWRDLWLSEGFASYAQVLWAEHKQGPEAADLMLRSYYAQILNPLLRQRGAAVTASPPPDRLFNPAVYLRGAWTLHALRLHLGDADFFALLRAYAAAYAHGNAGTQDFIDMAVQLSGDMETGALLHAWLYEETVPDVPQMGLLGR